ncbi:site-2 protease family protein [Limnochorda pilosa]|uniref:Zinc metalloprotease n=1 Tax=Limnochorda pilosa TaxID=1555112 RepID=A0A0K2SP89_LIMPI|nr:site-2 protease family protein [Limnochorda pilosa]BAS28953.1 peptidase [Limnochorda pilosa]
MPSFRLARVQGIPIEIHVSWLVVFALVSITLSLGYFPLNYPGLTGLFYGLLGLVTTLLFFTCVLLHELSHSLVAREHNLRIMRITLFIFGGVAHMQGEPPSPRAEFRIAVAGPMASLLIALTFRLVQEVGRMAGLGVALEALSDYLYWVNLLLALVNLIPAFPLDGGRILRAFLWARTGSLLRATRWAGLLGRGFAQVMMVGGLALGLFGPRLNGLWLLSLGWFLFQAARGSEGQVEVAESLRGLSVADVMEVRFLSVRRELPLDRFVEEYLLRHGQETFPVVQDGSPMGVVGLEEVRRVRREEWSTTTVQVARRPLEPHQVVAPGLPALEAARRLGEGGGLLLVVSEGQLLGVVTGSGLQRLVEVRRQILSQR